MTERGRSEGVISGRRSMVRRSMMPYACTFNPESLTADQKNIKFFSNAFSRASIDSTMNKFIS